MVCPPSSELPHSYRLVASIRISKLKVDFDCYTRGRYSCLATGSVENYRFQFKF